MAAKGKTRWRAAELAQMIDGYFASLEADPAKRGGPSDLLACIGMDMETATALAGETGGCGPVLRQAATRLRAHLETSPAWSGTNGSKSVFLIKQQLWDGQSYTDKRETAAAAPVVQVVFGPTPGADDAFG